MKPNGGSYFVIPVIPPPAENAFGIHAPPTSRTANNNPVAPAPEFNTWKKRSVQIPSYRHVLEVSKSKENGPIASPHMYGLTLSSARAIMSTEMIFSHVLKQEHPVPSTHGMLPSHAPPNGITTGNGEFKGGVAVAVLEAEAEGVDSAAPGIGVDEGVLLTGVDGVVDVEGVAEGVVDGSRRGVEDGDGEVDGVDDRDTEAVGDGVGEKEGDGDSPGEVLVPALSVTQVT